MVPAVKKWQFDVFVRRCPGQQIKTLKDETDFAVPNVSKLVSVQFRNIRAIEHVTTGRRPIEATENIHERRFARAARAHQGNEFTALNLERNAAHRPHFHLAGAIRFMNIIQ